MKRSGLWAIDERGLGWLIFFFSYNGLRGVHKNSIHLETERPGDLRQRSAKHVLSR